MMKTVSFDSREEAEECIRDVIFEYLDLLQGELKPLTVDELLKKMNGHE